MRTNVPQCALAIEALVRRAGFPRGTLQTLLIEVDTGGGVLLADERVAAVTVTGSEGGGAGGGGAGGVADQEVVCWSLGGAIRLW